MEEQSPFSVRLGIYVVPDHGRVDARNPLADETLVKLYRNPAFPFISLNAPGVKLLKKERLETKEIARLILRAKTVEEVDLLLEVRSNKVLDNIASTKKENLKTKP